MMRARTMTAALGAAVLLVAAVGVAATSASGAPEPAAVSAEAALQLLPLQTADRRIVDTAGRDVLLRGANVNVLGEYWQGVPSIPATIPLTDADWDVMASRGFSVIRLLITWSRVEPQRGVIDQGYLDQVDELVQQAASHGIYSVIDMHQDAYSAFISTTDPASCPPGTTPAKGWDGAPAWATLTDGLSTCLLGSDRNSSPAVERAWNNFYDDVAGIRTRFVASWAAVAERFAGRPEVAGFDVLNEPENPRPAGQLQSIYDDFLADVILAIRAAQAGAPFDHIVFVEPALPAADLTRGIVIPSPAALGGDVTNVAASVHNYMESIGDQLTLEQMNDLIETITAGLGVANWGGEYGFWDTQPDTLATARRYAADEDAHLWGGAWWQWRQSCGDPHSVHWSGSQVVSHSGTETHLNLLGCPGNVDLGPNDAFLDILGRGYPRAAPGRLVEVRSDPTTGSLEVTAAAPDAGGQLVVWTPTAAGEDHPIYALGLADVTEHAVPGGRIITATVAAPGTYSLWIGRPDDPSATTTSSTAPTTTSTTVGPTETTIAPAPTTSTTLAGDPRSAARATGAPGPAPAVRTTPTFTG
jgi:endoglycosylceramidase